MRMPDPCDDTVRLKAIVTAHLGEKKAKSATKLIGEFVARALGGEVLATDQLLNAIQLVMGAKLDKKDAEEMTRSLTAGLGR